MTTGTQMSLKSGSEGQLNSMPESHILPEGKSAGQVPTRLKTPLPGSARKELCKQL